ncbi:MAG TPA: TonB-dependent receptor [Allosphingosinicella sp.]|nr:TonB-dependent receptor [Allosphingosinicella sp.]
MAKMFARALRPGIVSRSLLGSSALGLLSAAANAAPAAPPADAPAAQTAPAAQASQPPASSDLGDIVVTARRVQESQQRVPIAITSFDQDMLERNRIQSLSDLQQFVPSASVTGYNSRNQEWFSLRGQGQTGFDTGGGVGGGPAVVGYLAEVPVNIAGPGLYYDLASVQVLKGPQGTLFGRNTTGGAILFEPRMPTDRFEGYGEATIGDYGRYEFQGALNVPLGGGFDVRVAGQTGHRDGYTHDVLQNVDYERRDFDSIRVGIRFASGGFENYLLGTYTDYRENGSGNILLYANPNNPALVAALAQQKALGIRRTQHSVTDEQDKGRFLTFIDRASLRLSDNVTLRNIASFTHYKTLRRVDEDGTALIILDSTGPLPGDWQKDQEVFTDELQLQGRFMDGRLMLQGGGYYEHGHNPTNTSFSQQFAPTFFLDTFRIDQSNISKGLYAQGTATIVDGLKATAGYRHTWDKVGFGFANAGSASQIPKAGDPCFSVFGSVYPVNCLVSDSSKDDGSSYTFGLDWQVDPKALLYVVTRQGYKSGGFNIIATQLGATSSAFFRYKPERVRDVEGGLKTDWSIGSAHGRTNLAVYYSKYKDAQVLTNAVIGAGGVQGVTANAARATIWGVEAENIFRPTPNVELNLTYSYLHAAYDRYVTPLGNDLSNTPYPNAPRNKLAAGARFRLPLGEHAGNLWIGGTYTFQDSIYVGIGDNGPGSPGNVQPSYGLVNLRADWYNVLGSKFDLALFVTNVTNKGYQVTALDLYNTLGFTAASFGEPRMFGGTIRYAF